MNNKPIIFPLFNYDELALGIQKNGHYELGSINQHQFPDGETVFKIETEVTNRPVVFIASLDTPNPKIVPLLFAAETARALGASQVILIAPYLAYMRQDKVFEQGQGITSQYFAKLISHYFDGLITLDPHLHRWHSLNDVYEIPTEVLHATKPIAHWIRTNIKQPLLIGPDEESMQWVNHIADEAQAPFVILEKNRKGDRSVDVSIPNLELYSGKTPILIDDIISTGMTMIEAVKQLHSLNLPPPVCIGVHAIFAGEAYQQILAAGVDKIITCNTVRHPSNAIDISNEIIQSLKNIPWLDQVIG
ncbi:ribose-phosphate pyrophosphokinase [Legionella quateirensis]|uniref:ribose-phosphate diphosphokinase n=1 Tax=Legionella quateirensis TaxID=45072 RepID=A0A378KTN2_9GAMM|nr:ribose-phosphate pyrophosphokinase [Legionella quateirensis]KTD44483.1 phosphoribosylpyrophosphate synthetase [Legionella quateirensis]STY16971.1 ribose-phosphate pyrophosphokinase [Legionella quateirensis]